ncbi:MAG: hypothetical protein ACPG71_04740 [Candidatus Puniceispirillaceae bacterium]
MKTLLFIAHTPSENTRLLATQAIASIQEYAPSRGADRRWAGM